jgi:membrane protein YdbS with pleckstrin-like domain
LKFQEWFYGVLAFQGITDPLAMSVALGVIVAVFFFVALYFAARVARFLYWFFVEKR